MKNERPILSIYRQDKLNVGIAYDSAYAIPTNVPAYEEHSIRIKCGYTIPEWRELQCEDKATEIALNRITDAIEYHRIEAEGKYQERMSKK